MTVVISTEGFWRALARFAWRRLTKPGGRIPDGVPGIRDPEARCNAYSPRKRTNQDWECPGDGHYLCKEDCAFYSPDEGNEE